VRERDLSHTETKTQKKLGKKKGKHARKTENATVKGTLSILVKILRIIESVSHTSISDGKDRLSQNFEIFYQGY